ncbi:ion transporter [Glaciecola petra]|uniref:Ion transporter n=1 Tax=Glaciecola petra TaxID=3075602 RepID=A0ABU2ZPC1_9ALTE|nr:ion transporter [Aestuariibacter sp. P117]MDT0594116.1 ion transporter [Aestuariibacter sp. P117]
MINFSFSKLKSSHEGPWLIVDLFMLFLLVVNLCWLLFDGLFATGAFKALLSSLSPSIVEAYAPVHENFLLYDLAFIAIFLAEFCVRWVAAVVRKIYTRWYFFPFIHWYDLVGCIPLGGARVFRFLRIFSILYRLQKFEIIDIRNTAVYRFITFYYNVFVEELSDRIVVKVLSDAQKDIAAGSPLIEDIGSKVIASRLPILTQWVSSVMVHVGESIEQNKHAESVINHVHTSVSKAVRENPQVASLKLVPVLGNTIERTLEQSVTDIVTKSIINLLKDATPEKIDDFIEHGLGRFSSEDHMLDQEVLLIVNECIELIKQHVSQKRWKETFQEDLT